MFQSSRTQQGLSKKGSGAGPSCFGPSKASLGSISLSALPFHLHTGKEGKDTHTGLPGDPPTKPTPALEEGDKARKLARPAMPPTSLRGRGRHFILTQHCSL